MPLSFMETKLTKYVKEITTNPIHTNTDVVTCFFFFFMETFASYEYFVQRELLP